MNDYPPAGLVAAMPAPVFIDHPPPDIEGWIRCFDVMKLPVLEETAARLELLRSHEESVDARLLSEAICTDPLMTIKLLSHVSVACRRRDVESQTDAETVTAALLMLGIGPFFRVFGPQESAESILAEHPRAAAGFQQVLRRAHRAANFAGAFAIRRMDQDAAVLHEAALLHEFAELLLWLRAPALAAAVCDAKAADPELRSTVAQRRVLNIELRDLQQALMVAWHLPPFLVRLEDERHVDTAQVKNVLLAIRVARHSDAGWENPALKDDVMDIGLLLNLGPAPTLSLLQEVDS